MKLFFQPTVSVGNVGQLAADLVVSTLWMERVGFILHPSLLPCVGNNPFAHEDATSCKITTCCEGTQLKANLKKPLHLKLLVLPYFFFYRAG